MDFGTICGYLDGVYSSSTSKSQFMGFDYPNGSTKIGPELQEAIQYDKIVRDAYGIDPADSTIVVGDLGPYVGGATDSVSGTTYYNTTCPFGMDYEMIVEHERFHGVQLKVAEEFDLPPQYLDAIKPLLEGQNASILDQEVYPQERELYERFMELDKSQIPNGPYRFLREYLEAVKTEAHQIDLHPRLTSDNLVFEYLI